VSPGAVAEDIWNLPNTAIGLTVGGLDILAGVAEGQLPSFSFSPQGALQISSLPNVIGFEGAITFGDVQLYTGVRPTTILSWPSAYTGLSGFTFEQHEDGHTIQSSILGPLFFPAYGAGALLYGWDSNPFETHADQHAALGTSALP